jgi:ornithine cyclodeaminase/alanine dehydrogenase-like protein (mu-crystallin family)
MPLQIIDAAQVRAQLSMRECIAAMADAMAAVTTGTLVAPARIIMPLVDGSGYFALMPGSASEPRVYGAKVVSLHPDNPSRGLPAVQGFVVLFDHDTGTPVVLVDGAEITALRTAAASALATRTLALPTARTLGIFGCGVQAASHLEAIRSVRDIEEVLVWGRSRDKAQAFVERHDTDRDFALRVASARDAAACDIVCVVTGAHEPVIEGAWLCPGSHVNLVGAHSAATREADTALIARASVFVDSLESAFKEAGDILLPIQEGAIDRAHVRGEIGAVLLGQIAGRRSADEITVYKSLGLVAQDLVAAHAVFARSRPPIRNASSSLRTS